MSRNFSTSAKATISSNLRLISARRHAEDRAVEEDVFAAGQFGVKAGADLEQAGDAAAQHDPPLGRLGDAAQDLEQRALAGAVAADDAQDLALLDLEADILERPEFLDLVALNDLSSANDVDSFAGDVADLTPNHVAQSRIVRAALAAGLMAHQVFFGQVFDGDDCVGHRYCGSSAFKSDRQSFFRCS